MAYTLTYSSLITELERFVDDDTDEFEAALPGIIQRSQDQVQRDLDLSIWRTFQEHHVTANSNEYAREPTWLRVLSIFLPDEDAYLQRRSLDYVRMVGGSGVPHFFAEMSESKLFIAPKPLLNHNTIVEVHTRLPALSASQTTNWISTNAADLLFLRCLIESERFLIGPERVGEFQAAYQEALSAARYELRGIDREDYTPVRAPSRPGVAA